MFLLLAVLLLLLLPEPWNVVGALAALAIGGAEVLYFYRRMRGDGETLRVVAVDGLKLDVERVPGRASKLA